MNFRITTFALLVAATCGLAFNQAAQADDDEERHIPSMRFQFEGHPVGVDRISNRRSVYTEPQISSVRSGSAPKSLLGFDPNLFKPAAPVVATMPVVQQQVGGRISASNPFASIFKRPTQPLIAQGATPLAPVPWSPLKYTHSTPATFHTHVAARPTGKGHHAPVVAVKSRGTGAAPIASYPTGQGYTQGDVHPGYSSEGGTTIDRSVSASLVPKHKH